jgi:predicted ATPase
VGRSGAENLADGPVLPEPAGRRKQRLHFHRFMLRVHEELTALQGKAIRWRLSPTASKRKPTCSASMSFCL